MIGVLFIMIIFGIIGAISNANAKSNRTIYKDEDAKYDLVLKYAAEKYKIGSTYKYGNKEWTVENVGAGYPTAAGFPVLVHLERGMWPINDTKDFDTPETLSDEYLTNLLYEEKSKASEVENEILNKAKSI